MTFNKIRWILGVLLVFFLILSTNLIDRSNFIRVKESIATIYEDRLVAKDLVFELSLLIHEKAMANALSDSGFYADRNETVNKNIAELITRFRGTKLTVDEKRVLNDLQENLQQLASLEKKSRLSKQPQEDKPPIEKKLTAIEKNLYSLSKIQLVEGRKQLFIGKQSVASVELLTQLEIYLLIFLAVLIQVLILYNPKEKK